MKNYNLTDYVTFFALHTDMCMDLNADFADLPFTSDRFTDCEVLEVVKPAMFNDEPDFIIEISCRDGIKQYCMRPAINNGIITFDADKTTLFNSYIDKLTVAHKDWLKKLDEDRKEADIRSEIERKEREARKAAYEAKKAEREAEEKLKLKIIKAQQDFESKIRAFVKIDKDPIDWLKENTVSVTATIPSHLDKIFIKQFGDVPHKVVDSSRKTSGGYSMKFGPSFCLTVKKGTPIHPQLARLFKDNKLHDTSFIAKLVRDGELSFGKVEA